MGFPVAVLTREGRELWVSKGISNSTWPLVSTGAVERLLPFLPPLPKEDIFIESQ